MPTTRSRSSRGAALAIVVASAAIAFCCASPSRSSKPPAPIASAKSPPFASAPPETVDAGSIDASDDAATDDAGAASSGPLARGPGRELVNFAAALDGLSNKTRNEHVRVMWLGDSHGAGDYWSGALRTALQAKFGDGGPGFIHIGYKSARHDDVSVKLDGSWSMTPRAPSSVTRTGDGIFGLGGVMFKGTGDSPRATVELKDDKLPAKLLYDLAYRGSSGDEIELSFDGEAQHIHVRVDPSVGVHHVTHVSASRRMGVVFPNGEPYLAGVIVETDANEHPGVVLDTLGINGARLATPLAWDESSWASEVLRRAPSLVILEYGTNETSDTIIDPKTYSEHLAAVVERVRKAAPACDCLVLSNTDRANTEQNNEKVRDALRFAAGEVGCAFWDTYEKMGGAGSIVKWRGEMPPRAGPDGVHLTWRGYRSLGDELSKFVLGEVTRPR